MTSSGPDQAQVDVVVAVHHPLRRRLLEMLTLDGPATASALAGRTDQLVGNISHHLKVLARAGLIAEAPELAKDRRERWWRAQRLGISWSVADAAGDAAGEALLGAAEQQNLAHQVGKVQQWYAERDGYDEAWQRAAFSTDTWIEVTADELSAITEQIAELLRPYAATSREPDPDGPPRQRVFVFSHGVPARS